LRWFRGTKKFAAFTLCLLMVALFAVPARADTPAKAKSGGTPASSKVSAPVTKSKKSTKKRARAKRKRGQQAMQFARIREIQAALIRENYLAGKPSGVWDQRSQQAMLRFQSDNGWQTKVLPDSRALIKLGLGPDQSAVINPDALQPSAGGGMARNNQQD
jgi:peptidoglycan hydrolase-like protein with peptidoglycan-binding domain